MGGMLSEVFRSVNVRPFRADYPTRRRRARRYDVVVLHLATMTKQEHDCANCPNHGACRKPHAPAILSLNRGTTAAAPPPRVATTTALAPRFARAYAAECRRPSIDGELLLRDVTMALVERLKSDGLPPERVLMAIKAAIARYADLIDAPTLVDDDARGPSRSVYRRVLQWMLASYFDEAV